MKRLVILSLCVLSISTLAPRFNTGSRNAGLVVGEGGSLIGTISVREGAISVAGAERYLNNLTITGERASISYTNDRGGESIVLNGTYTDGDITLGDGEFLSLDGGVAKSSVTILPGANARVEGDGSLWGGVYIGSGASLELGLTGAHKCGLHFESADASIWLANDLTFGEGGYITAEGSVDTNGYQLTFGEVNGQLWDWPTHFRSLDITRLALRGSITLSGKFIFESTASMVGARAGLYLQNQGALTLAEGVEVSLHGIRLHSNDSQESPISIGTGAALVLKDVAIMKGDDDWDALLVERARIGSVGAVGGFWGDVSWIGESTLTLLDDVYLRGKWQMQSDMSITGGGHTIVFDRFADSSLAFGLNTYTYLADLKLVGLSAGSLEQAFSAPGSYGHILFSHVTVADEAGRNTMTIVGSTTPVVHPGELAYTDGLTEVVWREGARAGDFFSADVSFVNGAAIELNSQIALEGKWSFLEDSKIEGNGYTLNTTSSAAKIYVAPGKKLEVANVTLYGVGGYTDALYGSHFLLGSDTSEVHFSNVTLILNDNFILNKGKWFVEGPVTAVTSNYSVQPLAHDSYASDGSYRLTVKSTTLWYDTLSAIDNKNITPAITTAGKVLLTGFGGTTASIARVMRFQSGDVSFVANNHLSESLALYRDTAEGYGVQLYFDNGDYAHDLTLDGGGRSIYFGDTRSSEDRSLLIMRGTWRDDEGTHSNNVTLKNIILDGLVSAHIKSTHAQVLTFGDYTTILMQSDDTLTRNYRIQTTGADQAVTLDLGGKVLDLNGHSLDVISGSLVVKNGTLRGFSSSAGVLVRSGASVVYDNVRLELIGDATFETGMCIIRGTTTLAGKAGSVFRNTSLAETSLRIDSHSTFVIENTLSYAHLGSRIGFTMAATTSRLFLNGGVFQTAQWTSEGGATAYLDLLTGRLIADHTAKLRGNFRIYTNCELDVLPGATITVEYGTVSTGATI